MHRMHMGNGPMKRFIVTFAAAAIGALSAPAAAQDEARVNQLIIYGDD